MKHVFQDEYDDLGNDLHGKHQSEPVAWLREDGDGGLELTASGDGFGFAVYTHADPAEVERLSVLVRGSRASLDTCALQIESLQAQLAEAQALLTKAGHKLSDRGQAWLSEQIFSFLLSASAEDKQ